RRGALQPLGGLPRRTAVLRPLVVLGTDGALVPGLPAQVQLVARSDQPDGARPAGSRAVVRSAPVALLQIFPAIGPVGRTGQPEALLWLLAPGDEDVIPGGGDFDIGCVGSDQPVVTREVQRLRRRPCACVALKPLHVDTGRRALHIGPL